MAFLMVVFAAVLVPVGPAATAEVGPVLVSRADDGRQGNDNSERPSISGDGRFVAFQSRSLTLHRGDQNTHIDIYLHDRVLGTTILVSRSTTGAAASGDSQYPSVSSDGRYVAFQSQATNLVDGDTNGHTDIFVFDRLTGTTRLVSSGSGGTPADGGSHLPSISSDGNVVVFSSRAENFGPVDTNGTDDVYAVNVSAGQISLVSRTPTGVAGGRSSTNAVVSGNGRYVAFRSLANDLVVSATPAPVVRYAVFRRDLVTGTTQVVSRDSFGREQQVGTHDPAINDDGSRVAYRANSANGLGGTTLWVWSASSDAGQIVSLTPTGTPTGGNVFAPSLSGDGRFVGFHSDAADLVEGDTNARRDVFVRDLAASRTVRLSQRADGVAGDGDSDFVVLDRTGTYVAFESSATNLIPGDTNTRRDVFVRDSIAASEPDVEGPLVAAVDVDPLVIDAATVNRSVRLTMRLLDRSGVEAPQLMMVNAAGQSTSVVTASLVEGGSPTDGTWEATVELPGTLTPAVWHVRHLDLRDTVGNISVAATMSDAVGLNVIDGAADSGAPLIAAFGVSPDVVDASTGAEVTVLMRVVDPTGVLPPSLVLAPPTGLGSAARTMTLDSGTIVDGQWSARFTIPAGAEAGGWQVSIVALSDSAGNGVPAGPPAGFDAIVTVVPAGSGAQNPDDPTNPPPGTVTPIGPGAAGYWMLGETGNVHAFGQAPYRGAAVGFLSGPAAVDIEPLRSGTGYWVLDNGGRVHAYGSAAHHGDMENMTVPAGERAAALSANPDGSGYWIFTNRGRAVPFGAVVSHGDVSHLPLNGPIIDSVGTPTGRGYYMVASDGGIFALGDAEFRGSMGGVPLNRPVVGLAPTPTNGGYWLVASDGGVFAFGDAGFRGSMGGRHINRAVTGMVAYGAGYLLVAADGGIFSFSDRAFAGSLGGNPPSYDIVSVAPLP